MVREETRGTARVVWLDRSEKRNAISAALATQLCEAILRASLDNNIRGVVIGSHGTVFAAGADLDELDAWLATPGGEDRVIAVGQMLAQAIEDSDVPVIGAISGHVYGGGCELMLLFDALFAEQHVEFAFRHAAMGLAPAWGASTRLILRSGPLVARRLLMSAEIVSAPLAAELGLVNKVCATGESLHHALAHIDTLSRLDRDAVAAQRRSLSAASHALCQAGFRAELEAFKQMWGGPAHRDALGRFRLRSK